MHLYAFTREGKILSVSQADKHQDYFCLECRGLVRKRGGRERISHFFHLGMVSSCRQEGKSLEHLQTQRYLQSILPTEDCQLEYPFPRIKRIADVVWFSKKIIFEVQCSPISPQEVQERIEDYASAGYQVVWILHDQRFNQWKVTAAENFLRRFPHYYTQINAEGDGFIYDQEDLQERGIRRKRSLPARINPSQPHFTNPYPHFSILKDRTSYWPLYFEGDLIHQAIENGSIDLMDEKTSNKRFQSSGIKTLLFRCFIHPYKSLFRLFLENVCK